MPLVCYHPRSDKTNKVISQSYAELVRRVETLRNQKQLLETVPQENDHNSDFDFKTPLDHAPPHN